MIGLLTVSGLLAVATFLLTVAVLLIVVGVFLIVRAVRARSRRIAATLVEQRRAAWELTPDDGITPIAPGTRAARSEVFHGR